MSDLPASFADEVDDGEFDFAAEQAFSHAATFITSLVGLPEGSVSYGKPRGRTETKTAGGGFVNETSFRDSASSHAETLQGSTCATRRGGWDLFATSRPLMQAKEKLKTCRGYHVRTRSVRSLHAYLSVRINGSVTQT